MDHRELTESERETVLKDATEETTGTWRRGNIVDFPRCPVCGGEWVYYDGALGYETLKCEKRTCGTDIKDLRYADEEPGHEWFWIIKRRAGA